MHQNTTDSIKGRKPNARVWLLAFLGFISQSANGAVVLDQIGSVGDYDLGSGSSHSISQIFTDFPDFDSAVLEDFSVTSSQLQVNNVSALFKALGGFTAFQDVEAYALNFYSDPNLAATSLTGDIASLLVVAGGGAMVTEVVEASHTAEFGLVSLATDLTLPGAGTYWVSISPRSANSQTGQFEVMAGGASGPVTTGSADAVLATPRDGFGQGAFTTVQKGYAYSVTVVPEPSSAWYCLITASACLLWRGRRR